ncbi:MAG: 30S ribosome-binding factor RbfA [Pirellula sp.]
MSSRRLLKAGEAIREVVSMAILTELRDPRVKNVTVIGVEVAPDMREAKVLVSIMGNESQQATSLRGLKNSAGFLQSKIAERIDARYIPKLTFVADEGVKKSLAVAQILDQIALEKQKEKLGVPLQEPADDEQDDQQLHDEPDDDEQDDDEQLVDQHEIGTTDEFAIQDLPDDNSK